jgi:FKBP-type peptidyl-prolyl cis-trans isomerase 2
MSHAYRNKVAIALTTVMVCLWILSQQSLAAGSSRVTEGSIVTLMYHITVPGQAGFEVRDISQFVQGQHQMLPTVERVVNGMKTGDEKKVELSPEQGFGPYDANKKKTVSRAELPGETKEGDILEDRTGTPATVAQLSDSSAVIDYNHPLAGKPLSVKVRILRVDDPS